MRNWKMRVDVSDFLHEDKLPFVIRRDGIVEKLDALVLQDVEQYEHTRYEDIVDALRFSDNEDEFDGYWDDLYDWADDNGLWVEGF